MTSELLTPSAVPPAMIIPLLLDTSLNQNTQALSAVIFLLDACAFAVSVVAAFQLAVRRYSDQLVLYVGGVVLAAVSTFLVRAMLPIGGSVIEVAAPAATLLLIVGGLLVGKVRGDRSEECTRSSSAGSSTNVCDN
ncbi:hypothetical protein [Pseudonocardia parietis]|uniref:Nicotinamide riboside transporter PnuC n=1 Tax=Pseudonocardia parietis TaxID=570936 RepID=A0ABS4W7T2_9PSEU|nr:hypothetical protein [Pseudonocardia parietis]MBP2372086.1 nicotinamide riboside transporter PnuC [Pseudonocardia parietis]